MRIAGVAAVILVAGCTAPAPPAVSAEVACVPAAHALRQLCTVTLTDRHTAKRLEGATVTLSADMPSMPLAHSVRPVPAEAVAPGVYRGTLELEMAGRWIIAVRVAGPVTDQLTHALEVP